MWQHPHISVIQPAVTGHSGYCAAVLLKPTWGTYFIVQQPHGFSIMTYVNVKWSVSASAAPHVFPHSSLIFLNWFSRCFRVPEHRDLHVAAETVQPGDICGFAGVGGRWHEVSLWCGWSYPLAGWVATNWPCLLSYCTYQWVPWGFRGSRCCDTELF